MSTLNDFNYTDHVDDVLAVYVNRLLAATMRSEYKNVETLSGARELEDADTPIQRFDCDESDRVVTMPSENAVSNHPYWIVNASSAGETITVMSNDEAETLGTIAAGQARLFLPDGAGGYRAVGGGDVTPYRIAVSVASNNLTLALKDKDGNDPSPSSPVRVQIGDTVRTIDAPLSVTKNAGTNWCNAGGAELAAKEIDYFAYLGYNATDGVVIGFSRIPFARIYSDFSATTTNEKYAAISTITNAASNDAYTIIGRFAATLSAGAGYTWSVPTFTAANLIHEPITRTRLLDWTPVVNQGGSSNIAKTINAASYSIGLDGLRYTMRLSFTGTGTGANAVIFTLPFTPKFLAFYYIGFGSFRDNGTATYAVSVVSNNSDQQCLMTTNAVTAEGGALGINPNFAIANNDTLVVTGFCDL